MRYRCTWTQGATEPEVGGQGCARGARRRARRRRRLAAPAVRPSSGRLQLSEVESSSRSRSGLAWARCSSSIRAGSILGVSVIVVSFFESAFADHSKDHPMAVTYVSSDTPTGIRTPLCRTSLTSARHRSSCRTPRSSPWRPLDGGSKPRGDVHLPWEVAGVRAAGGWVTVSGPRRSRGPGVAPPGLGLVGPGLTLAPTAVSAPEVTVVMIASSVRRKSAGRPQLLNDSRWSLARIITSFRVRRAEGRPNARECLSPLGWCSCTPRDRPDSVRSDFPVTLSSGRCPAGGGPPTTSSTRW